MVDKYNEQPVSAYVTQGGAVLMLLHDTRPEDAVRHFFQEVHELFVKVRRRGAAGVSPSRVSHCARGPGLAGEPQPVSARRRTHCVLHLRHEGPDARVEAPVVRPLGSWLAAAL